MNVAAIATNRTDIVATHLILLTLQGMILSDLCQVNCLINTKRAHVKHHSPPGLKVCSNPATINSFLHTKKILVFTFPSKKYIEYGFTSFYNPTAVI